MINLAKLDTQNLSQEQLKDKKDKELRQACAGFEGMFMDMMMKSMRKATMESSFIKKSNGEKIFTEMLDQQYVDVMAKTEGSGLGETLYKHIKSTMPEYRDANLPKSMNPYVIQENRQANLNNSSLDLTK